MPVKVVERECTDSDGNKGSYVVIDPNGKQHGCHQSRENAEAQRDAINASEQAEKMNKQTEQTP